LKREPTLLVAGGAATSSPLEGGAYTPHRFLPLEGGGVGGGEKNKATQHHPLLTSPLKGEES